MSTSPEREAEVTVGLDIGGTKVLGVVLDHTGTILHEQRAPSPDTGFEPLVAVCRDLVAAIGPPDAPVGVGAAGLVGRTGVISYAPNLPGVIDAPIRDAVAAATGRRVAADNDANVAALAEATYGAAVGARHALMVTLGTGIGGGIIADGEVYHGANGYAAEFGHFTVDIDGPICACGERGHWEAIASGNALGRMAREMIEHGRGGTILAAAAGRLADVSGEEVAAAAGEGDADARALLAAYADNIALGLVNLANILDPERIVISGGVVEIGALLFEPLGAAFRAHLEGTEHRPDIALVPAAFGERAGAVGAAVLARSL
jgi:glucokinase